MPMKIEGMTAQGPSVKITHDHDERTEGSSADFSTALMDEEDTASTQTLEKMLKQIDEQGAKLSRTPTYDELKAYRTLIKNFVGEAVNHMYELHTQAGWDRMGRQKVYTTVRKVDKKLEEMAEKIRLGQADQLDIIASHDAIRGMLVDLYM